MKYQVHFTVCVELEIEQPVFDAVLTDEWRSQFYQDVRTGEDVAAMIALNHARNHVSMPSLDGFADLDPKLVKVTHEDWDVEEVKGRP